MANARQITPAGVSRVVAVLLLAALACADEPRVGVVDVQEAFQRSPLVMVSALELKGDLGATPRDLKKRGRALAELRMQLEHGGLELSPEERAELEARIEDEARELVELQRRYRVDLAAARAEKGQEMIARVEEVAREVASQEGLTLLIRKDGILYDTDPPPVDITDQVIRALLAKINPTEIPAADTP